MGKEEKFLCVFKSWISGPLNNKAGYIYTATLVACGWAGAALEKVTRALGQYAQKAKKR